MSADGLDDGEQAAIKIISATSEIWNKRNGREITQALYVKGCDSWFDIVQTEILLTNAEYNRRYECLSTFP